MKRKRSISHIILIVAAISAILYWLFLTLRYGTLTFLNLFLYSGIIVLFSVMLLHFLQIRITDYLPKRFMRIIRIAFAVILMIFIVTEGTIIYNGYHETKDTGDTILVLGAGLINGNQLSLTLLYRLQRAYEEYQKNPNSMIVVSGGQGSDETISEAEAMKQWLMKYNIDESHILTEDRSRNTNENFLYSAQVMKQHGIVSKRISLITNRFHMKRAADLGKINGFTICQKPADDLEYAQPCFYTREFFGLIRAYLFHY